MQRSFRALAAALALIAAGAAVAYAGASPAVSTGPITLLTPVSAELHGTVNPEGTGTTYVFEWGLTNLYGDFSKTKSAGDGPKAIAIEGKAGSLIPGTIYHYRVVANNKFGVAASTDRTFKTAGHPPPGAATGAATAIGPNNATLTGSITPNGANTPWTFQYGITTAYGNQVVGAVVPGASPTTTVNWTLTGLAPATLFHYRLIATHSNSLAAGLDATFFTMPFKPERSRLRAHTRPRRARRRPFVFTTFGSLAGPANIPVQYACTGSAVIRYFFKRREVGATLAAVQPNCTFSATISLAHRFGRRAERRSAERLKIVVRYLGNGYLAARSRTEHVQIG
jgi:hypothetical protein